MSRFLSALEAGEKALNKRNLNLQSFYKRFDEAKYGVEDFTDRQVTLVIGQTLIDNLTQSFKRFDRMNGLKTVNEIPRNLVIQATLTKFKDKSFELTKVELGPEVYPCTIYVEGDQLTASDELSFDKNLVKLLSSPTVVDRILFLKEMNKKLVSENISKTFNLNDMPKDN